MLEIFIIVLQSQFGGFITIFPSILRLTATFARSSSANYSIVIARYKEDLQWLDEQSANLSLSDVYIYNKGGELYKPFTYVNNFLVPNLGREVQTFLNYLVTHYDQLKEHTILATPDWRYSTFSIYPSSILGLVELCNRVTSFITAKQYFSNDGYYFTYQDFRISSYKGKIRANKDNLAFGAWMRKYIEPDLDAIINKTGYIFVNYQGTMCVRRENILSRPKEFYAYMLTLLDENNEVGHFFERSWFYLFNIHKLNGRDKPLDNLICPARYLTPETVDKYWPFK